uniref:helix-turn-helix domain-containing protein n=1 Tax=Gordonia rhizosphera TaxID=83341 RepID=UPI0009FD9AF7|nr:helix-turn-helix domain-containing protein [Gordonia rhizosphera]
MDLVCEYSTLKEQALRVVRILLKALRIARGRVIGAEFTADDHGPLVLVRVEAHARARSRCPHCNRVCGGYDRADRARRWRHLDIGGTRCFSEARVSRLRCARHGVVTEKVPWARPGTNLTRAFDDLIAWLCAHSPASAVCQSPRVSWRTVRRVVERVVAEATGSQDRPAQRVAAHRHRRDRLPQRPPLPDRGRRSRHRPAGLGR